MKPGNCSLALCPPDPRPTQAPLETRLWAEGRRQAWPQGSTTEAVGGRLVRRALGRLASLFLSWEGLGYPGFLGTPACARWEDPGVGWAGFLTGTGKDPPGPRGAGPDGFPGRGRARILEGQWVRGAGPTSAPSGRGPAALPSLAQLPAGDTSLLPPCPPPGPPARP
uniref:Uncharacterized protein n=1 Tax=Rangifer tarandus platyrhynchus TaxID=3082113 RepID=A0ACB0EK11_RANTA|nr:unnamed protein product [Rangifer tarandus platyrhynchus]